MMVIKTNFQNMLKNMFFYFAIWKKVRNFA